MLSELKLLVAALRSKNENSIKFEAPLVAGSGRDDDDEGGSR